MWMGKKFDVAVSLNHDVMTSFETVQIEIGLSEYGGNKKAVRTDGLLAKHKNLKNAITIFFHHNTLKEGGAR